MRRGLVTVGSLAGTAVLAAAAIFPAGAAPRAATDLRSTLAGSKVIPPPGDPDGRGSARVTIRGTRVCWRLRVTGIERPHSAHIHAGTSRSEGPAVVPLFLRPRSLERPRRGCTRTGRLEAGDIARHPRRYYVNVHNDEFPNGAVRGQLSRAPRSPRSFAEPRFAG